MRDGPTTFPLGERDIPTHWINLAPDLPEPPLPPLHPGTLAAGRAGRPRGDLPAGDHRAGGHAEPLEVEIPEQVREAYKLWRPTPLFRARRLERALDTPAHIYVKYEGVSPAGSHKPNSAVAQAYENARAGVQEARDRDGRGPVGLGARVRVQPVRARVRGLHGRLELRPEALPPLDDADVGRDRAPLAERADGGGPRRRPRMTTGSLGIAISEAVEVAASDPDASYALGSVLNHVCLHQTVIGQEAMSQLELAGEAPDVVVGCVGGGSNFAGLAFPFMRRVLRGRARTRFVAAEPAACPTLTRGAYRYDFGDTAGLTPLLPMYTLGHDFVPPPMHAGGLRYHGDAPLLCALVRAVSSRRAPTARTTRSRRPCGSRARRGSSRRPSRRTRSARRSTRRSRRARRASGA